MTQPSDFTDEPEVWSPRCHCGESVIPITDLDGRLYECCVRGHVSKTTVQRRQDAD